MLLLNVLLLLFASIHASSALSSHFRDCSDRDCYFYDNPQDERNSFLDLQSNIEIYMNDSIALPDWKLLFSFTGGKFMYDHYSIGDGDCICPLQKRETDVYATYHTYLPLSYYYQWTYPSTNLSGEAEIDSELYYSILLHNKTDSLPKVVAINITSLRVYNWWFGGFPLEELEDKIPDEEFKKAAAFILKPFTENKLMTVYNEAIENIFKKGKPGLRKMKRNRKIHRPLIKPIFFSKFSNPTNFLKTYRYSVSN